MAHSSATLKIPGYRGGQVPNTFWRQDKGADHIAIILPGRGYTVDMPLLYYPTELLLAHGADVMAAQYDYRSNTDFRELSEAERSIWIGSDVSAACRVALAQRKYARVTLIGKSLGTLAAAHLVSNEPGLEQARVVWLTPLVGSDTLREQIKRWGGPSLFVIGTADDAYDEADLAAVAQSTGGKALTIPDADHSLEIPGDVWRSLEVLQQVMREVDAFIAS